MAIPRSTRPPFSVDPVTSAAMPISTVKRGLEKLTGTPRTTVMNPALAALSNAIHANADKTFRKAAIASKPTTPTTAPLKATGAAVKPVSVKKAVNPLTTDSERARSSKTGQTVTPAYAKAHKATTTVESVPSKQKVLTKAVKVLAKDKIIQPAVAKTALKKVAKKVAAAAPKAAPKKAAAPKPAAKKAAAKKVPATAAAAKKIVTKAVKRPTAKPH